MGIGGLGDRGSYTPLLTNKTNPPKLVCSKLVTLLEDCQLNNVPLPYQGLPYPKALGSLILVSACGHFISASKPIFSSDYVFQS